MMDVLQIFLFHNVSIMLDYKCYLQGQTIIVEYIKRKNKSDIFNVKWSFHHHPDHNSVYNLIKNVFCFLFSTFKPFLV